MIALDSQISTAEAAGDESEVASLMQDLTFFNSKALQLESSLSNLIKGEQEAEVQRRAGLEQELAKRPEAEFIYSSAQSAPSGAYVPVMPPTYSIDFEKELQKNRQIAGELANASVGQGGLKGEMLPAGLRFQLGSLPTPESKAQLLQQNFPEASITPLNVAGNTEFLMKMPDGSVKTTFESGIAGTAGAAVVEIPLTAAQIAAGLGTVGATKSPGLGVTASAATRLGLGTAIDEVLRFGYGIKQDVGESVGRRGIEGLAELGFGMASDVAIPAIRAARIPNKFENLFAKTLETSAENLNKREAALAAKQGRQAGTIEVPAGAQLAGPEGLLAQRELAGEFPKSGIANSARKAQEVIVRLFDDFKSNAPATPNDFSAIAVNRNGRLRALANSIATATKGNERIVKEAIDRQFAGPTSNVDELGNVLRNSLLAAEEQAVKDVNQAYGNVFNLADNAGFEVTPSQLLDDVAQIKRELNRSGAADTGAIKGVEARLKERRDAPELLKAANKRFEKNPSQDLALEIQRLEDLSKPMTSRDFDDYIKAFRDARPEGGAVGGTTKDAFGSGIASKLSDYRMQRYGQLNVVDPNTGLTTNVGDVFSNTAQKVAERQAFEKNTLGGILREAAGEQATTPRDVVKAAMKDPFTVDRVTSALRQLGQADPKMAGEADRILGLMRTQYMNDIGIGGPNAVAKSRIDIDDGMLNALYGKEASGIRRGLESLNSAVRKARGLKVSDLTLNDVQRMGGLLSEKERNEVSSAIVKRIGLEREQQKLVNSQIFKLARKGDFENIDPDILSKAILSDSFTIGQTRGVMGELSRMSPDSRNLYKGDFIRELLDKYRGGDTTANAPFEPIFDARKFIADYESPGKTGKTQFAHKLESVLGKEDARFLYDLAKTYDANTLIDLSKKSDARLIAGKEGISVYLTTGLASKGRNRLLAAMLSSGSKRRGFLHSLKTSLNRNALPGGVNEAYNQMFKEAFLTRNGITALAHQAAQDPEFSAELTNMAKEFRMKEGIDMPEIIRK